MSRATHFSVDQDLGDKPFAHEFLADGHLGHVCLGHANTEARKIRHGERGATLLRYRD